MDITGHDSVIFTFTPHQQVFACVLAAILTRWPEALVDEFVPANSSPRHARDFPQDQLPTGPGQLLFYRDAAMAEHMNQAAYTPMADGDGPIAILTRDRHDVLFSIAQVDEQHAADQIPVSQRPPAPYPAWLCTAQIIEVTVVTPADPNSQAFSSWVLATVKEVCRIDPPADGQ